jgi:hypothetical protein
MPDRLPPTPPLECERLVLRPLRLEDAPVIQRRFPTWEVVRFLNGDHVPWPYPADGAASHIADCLGEMARGEKLYWAIALKDAPDELIGRIDLRPDDGRSRDMRGFWLDPEHHGKGFMTEAADRVRFRRTRLAASLALQRRAQRGLGANQGEAGRRAGRPRALPLGSRRGHAPGLAAGPRGMARAEIGVAFAGARAETPSLRQEKGRRLAATASSDI